MNRSEIFDFFFLPELSYTPVKSTRSQEITEILKKHHLPLKLNLFRKS